MRYEELYKEENLSEVAEPSRFFLFSRYARVYHIVSLLLRTAVLLIRAAVLLLSSSDRLLRAAVLVLRAAVLLLRTAILMFQNVTGVLLDELIFGTKNMLDLPSYHNCLCLLYNGETRDTNVQTNIKKFLLFVSGFDIRFSLC
jgi:hypothetical protein